MDTNKPLMIPKTIHYCWFGGNKLPKLAKRCIRSWRKYLPDYEIKEWNESNFDVNINPYVKEAYKVHRYAFMSDYARYWVLYHYGGVYFDTDVELLRSINQILKNGGYMSFETSPKSKDLYVNPGLGMAMEPGHPFLKEMLDMYRDLHFINPDGTHNLKSIVMYTSEVLIGKGLQKTTDIQKIDGINIYPKEYFNPYNSETKKFEITDKTYSIHYFAGSWFTKKERFMRWIESNFGKRTVNAIHYIYTKIIKVKD